MLKIKLGSIEKCFRFVIWSTNCWRDGKGMVFHHHRRVPDSKRILFGFHRIHSETFSSRQGEVPDRRLDAETDQSGVGSATNSQHIRF